MSIVESGSSSISSSSSVSSTLNSSSSGMLSSVIQEFVSLVTANFAPFGQRKVPDWSLEQQKLLSLGDPPQNPGHGPSLPLQSKRQFFSLFSSHSGTFNGFSEGERSSFNYLLNKFTRSHAVMTTIRIRSNIPERFKSRFWAISIGGLITRTAKTMSPAIRGTKSASAN